jgi:hypothetical protein
MKDLKGFIKTKLRGFLNERKLERFNLSPKTIMNIFLCDHRTPLDIWEQSIKIFKSFDLPTSAGISPGHHRGLAYQVLLDSDIKESQDLCDELISKFQQEPLIVLGKVNVKIKPEPIGEWQDDDLVGPGRYFDRLVREGKRGIFIYLD